MLAVELFVIAEKPSLMPFRFEMLSVLLSLVSLLEN